MDSEDKVYIYDGDKLLAYDGEECAYNETTNVQTTYRGKSLGWTNRRVTSYNGVQFSYDGQGRRIAKDGISYIYDSQGRLLKQSQLLQQDNDLEFFYDHSGVSSVKHGGKTYFYRKDILGNVIALLDTSGAVVVKYTYDAWGNNVVSNANNVIITDANHIGNLNPFRYRGYYYDTDTKLYYLKTRYYDPEAGRFISQDGIEYLDPETINGLNLYAYCGNNPISNVDPNGNAWWHWLLGAVAAVAIVALVTLATGGAALPVLIGAGIGAATSGVMSVVTQVMATGTINFAELVMDMSFGALTGAFGGTALGILGMTVAGGLTGFVSSVAHDVESGNGIQWGNAIISGVIGAAFGALTGGGAQYGKNLTLKSKINLFREKSSQGKPINALIAQIKNERNLLSKAGVRSFQPDETLLYTFILEYVAYGTFSLLSR